MKKNILYYLSFLFIVGLVATSCTKDDDENQFEQLEDVRGAVINVSNVQTGFFDIANPAATIAFDVGTFGESVSAATVTASYNDGDAVVGPVDVTTINSFPSTVTASLD